MQDRLLFLPGGNQLFTALRICQDKAQFLQVIPSGYEQRCNVLSGPSGRLCVTPGPCF